MQTKKEIREQVLQQRRDMNPEDVASLSGAICRRISEMPEYRNAEDICFYMPVNNEVDLRRGRKLRPGDVVSFGNEEFLIR